MRFAYTNANGFCSIVYATNEMKQFADTPLRDQAVAHIRMMATREFEPADWTELHDDVELPPYDGFRNAWVLRDGKIEIDMDKARAIFMAKLRELRDAKLKDLDIEFQRAFESKASLDNIYARKQALRDLPDTIDLSSATTTHELDALMPETLR